MSSRARWRDAAIEGIGFATAIAATWALGAVATAAWTARVAELGLANAPDPGLAWSGYVVASTYFTAGVVALAAGRAAGAYRTRHAERIHVPLLLPACVAACLLGFCIHLATVEVVRGTVLLPSGASFAQGFLGGGIGAALVLAAPWDLAALGARLQIPIAVSIGVVFVALAVAGSGPGTSGARINLGPVQPIEAVKLLSIVFLAAYLGARASKLRWQRVRALGLRLPRPRLLVPALGALLGIFAGLYLVGDLGPVLILALVFLGVFYAVTRAGGWAAGSLLLVAGFLSAGALWPDLVDVGRVVTRIQMWRDPWWNGIPHGDQLGESQWAIAAGGFTGRGLASGHAPLVPAGKTDLILATACEQIGAAGILLYVALVAVLVGTALVVARQARTPDRALFAIGAAVLLLVQWAVIHGGTFGLLPLTGVVVPFLSSGRTSMIVFVTLIGIVARVADDGPARERTEELEELRLSTRGIAVVAAAALAIGAGAVVHGAVAGADRRSALAIATRLADGTVIQRQNPRLLALAARIRRGAILDRHGAPLAVTDAAGGARRYPLASSMGTLLGRHPSPVLLPPWALERAFETRLRGYGERTDGPTGRPWADLRTFVPLLHAGAAEQRAQLAALDARVEARSVRVTIDADLQRRVAAILRRGVAAHRGVGAGAAAVIDVDTGHVLARAQVPDYDPSDPTWSERMRAGDGPFLATFTGAYGAWPDKTGVQGMFQSGSVGKLFTALAAARFGETGAVFECVERDEQGPFYDRPGWPRPIHDHFRDRNHGRVDLVEALAVSCNVYFAQLGLRLGPDPFVALRAAGADVGYGSAHAFDPGAAGSRQLASTAFGQGALVMNVVQAARLVAAIGSGGRYRRCAPTLELTAPCIDRPLLPDPRYAGPILAGMRRVMTDGTGRSLREPEGTRIYGKTGTADVRGFAGEEAFGIPRAAPAAPHSWFVALAEPIETPELAPIAPGRIAVAVVVPRSGAGATVAGPIAMEIVAAVRAR